MNIDQDPPDTLVLSDSSCRVVLDWRLTMPRSALSLPLRLQAKALLSRCPFLFNFFHFNLCSGLQQQSTSLCCRHIFTIQHRLVGGQRQATQVTIYLKRESFLVVHPDHFCRFICKVRQQLETSFGNNLCTQHTQGKNALC